MRVWEILLGSWLVGFIVCLICAIISFGVGRDVAALFWGAGTLALAGLTVITALVQVLVVLIYNSQQEAYFPVPVPPDEEDEDDD